MHRQDASQLKIVVADRTLFAVQIRRSASIDSFSAAVGSTWRNHCSTAENVNAGAGPLEQKRSPSPICSRRAGHARRSVGSTNGTHDAEVLTAREEFRRREVIQLRHPFGRDGHHISIAPRISLTRWRSATSRNSGCRGLVRNRRSTCVARSRNTSPREMTPLRIATMTYLRPDRQIPRSRNAVAGSEP